ncbi:MAG: LysM peptidoglycan-binding domain-containing protein [Bacteroidetes bacterium]|nr:MAG: LysM peptidoglycan-binding domain-containing protein [Bacteroidota bacterium]
MLLRLPAVSRFAAVVLVLLLVAPPARAQDLPEALSSEAASDDLPFIEPLDARPLRSLTFERRIRRTWPGSPAPVTWEIHPVSDTLTEAGLVQRIARIYDYQARLLQAEAQHDVQEAEALLERAMQDLATLLKQPGIMERPRFRELYRSVLTEYERYYGPSDTLDIQRGDIYPTRAALFAALEGDDDPLLEEALIPSLQPVETEIPMTMHRLVRQSIAYLLRSPDKHLYHWLGRAETYFPMIEQILAEEKAPDELKYLAMIESGLNPQARSWARAVGMWQFMTYTGRLYGLQVNAWVDERRDPEKATRAAARHLRDLYDTFGDWHLAIAAYNCGAGNVRKAQRRARARGFGADFWSIYPYLPRETRNYVPMFIAAALVASNPAAFNLDLGPVRPGPRYAYEYVPVQGMIALSEVARLAGTDLTTIRALNPELRRDYLPPSDGVYYVRIPLGTYGRFAAGYAQLPPEARATVSEHRVRRGETLGGIARKYGVSVAELRRANDIRGSLIRVGQELIVPMPRYDGNAALPVDLADARPITVQYGPRAIRPIAVSSPSPLPMAPGDASPPVVRASTPPAPAEPRREPASRSAEAEDDEPATRVVYQIRRGDTLGEIAQKYRVSVSDLRAWNNLRGNTIRAGQRLTIYLDGEAPDEPAGGEPEREITYQVRRGDTLGEIAQKYRVSVSDLRAWNNLRGNTIRVGQRLTIRPGGSAEAESAATTYTVRSGDSLYVIARRYGVTISDLKRWNNLRSNRLMPGQRLVIRP